MESLNNLVVNASPIVKCILVDLESALYGTIKLDLSFGSIYCGVCRQSGGTCF